ncbi:S49 family peptidase [Terrabacter ginsenosidimutans]|uniref:S49 family peptidase n=1 Tax=Terrabacter ginsenosidimutans TaxID=490575 RepID=A0ABP7DF10_9MICO
MASWNDLLAEFQARAGDDVALQQWLDITRTQAVADVSRLRGDRQVMVYASAFLQKPSVPSESLMITHEDLNGFMSAIYGMDCTKGLTLVIHTPGGVTNAAETVVAYLRSKFTDIEVIVPAIAMSAGTMISLAANRVIMGRQSQLGPIDPQMVGGGRQASARAITEQFERASGEVLANRDLAHVWAPILSSLGPALLQDAQNALDYSERMVAEWVSKWMFEGDANAEARGQAVAHHFNDASTHKSHGRRIDRDEARRMGVVIEDLEDDQALQTAVLKLYHLMTILFEQSPMTKMILSSTGATWVKNWAGVAQPSP